MEDKIDQIEAALKQKAILKQAIYRNTLVIFNRMKEIAGALTTELTNRFNDIDKHVIIEMKSVNEFEFRLKFSGDMLIFTMHSNVQTFPAEHILFNSPYVQENPARGYFGNIMVHNFMADSIKYNRLGDVGYLLARFLLNVEGHFFIEGVRPVSFLYPDIAQNQVNDEVLRQYIESAMLAAIQSDLQAPPFQQIQVIQLGTKLENQMVTGGEKVGFQMGNERKI